MKGVLRRFRRAEDGAVTVDWVVLTGAIVGLSIAVISVLSNSTQNVGDVIAGGLRAVSVDTSSQ
jgi:Flp pilus assembly pilin Flp